MKALGIAVVIVLALSAWRLVDIKENRQTNGTPKVVNTPKQTFEQYCAGCHGLNMERFAGKTWNAGISNEHLNNVIKFGLPTLGMPSFNKAFSDEEINALSSYILKELKAKPANTQLTKFPKVIKSKHLSYKIDTVASGLDVPWGFAFLPNGDMLVTERSGQLFRFSQGKLAAIVQGVPPVFNRGQGGLLDIKLHPDYKKNGWIYISYSQKAPNGDVGNTAILRAKLKNDVLVEHQELFKATPNSNRGVHFGCRMVFDKDGYLFFAVGDRGSQNDAQRLNNYNGKVHRLHDDGRIPKDNPFLLQKEAIQSIYSFGHRNPQGIDIHPKTQKIWANEHGPRGGDEINIIDKGKNYGWPEITYGINYDGSIITPLKQKEGMEQPVHQWTPSIAPSSMVFVTGNKYPAWEGDILSGSLSFKYLERTRIVNNKTVETEKLLENAGRVRHVAMGPDGYIYVAIESPGFIVRLIPVK